MTLVEIIIGISLMTLLAAITINVLHSLTSRDTDILKFKYVYAAVSEAVFVLKNDTVMYPAANVFRDKQQKSYLNDPNKYGGDTKFKKLFKSKFNVFQDVKFTMTNENGENIQAPFVYVYDRDLNENKFIQSSDMDCFLDNKGVLYCPPSLINNKNQTLLSIYLPVYINKINISDIKNNKLNSASVSVDKAIFFEIESNGKINIPAQVSNIINCYEYEYNKYNHCKAIEKMADLDF